MLARLRFTWLLLGLTVTLVLAVLALDLLTQQDLRSVSSITTRYSELSQTLRSWDSILTMVRLASLVGLFLGWRYLIHFMTSMHVLTSSAGESLINCRSRIFLWLLAIELMIGQQLLQHAVEILSAWL